MSPPGAHIRWIVRRLERMYGQRQWRRRGDGLEVLIRTILSQNTTDRTSGPAFENLMARFGTWEAVADAPARAIASAIRSAGLAEMKSRRIREILRQLRRERGTFSLDHLAEMPVAEAKAELDRFVGVGPKTSRCVLLFAFGRGVLPVDTHVYRISRRLGLIAERTSPARAHEELEAICPPSLAHPFHVLMIEHGRRCCRARQPDCPRCELRRRCPAREE